MGRRSAMPMSIARGAFGLALLTFLLWSIGPSTLLSGLQDVLLWYLALALLAQIAAKVVWALRWQEILRISGIEKNLIELLAVLHIGFFFNNFLPSSMGGDIARGYYSASRSNDLATAYGVVVAERLIGFVTLAVMCGLAIVVLLLSDAHPFPEPFLILSLAVSVGLVLAGAVVFFTDGWTRLVQRPFSRRPRAFRLIADLSRALQFARCPGGRIWYVAFLSILLQLIGVLFYLASARAVGITLPSSSFFFVVPLAVLASMLPISLNGLGVREGALVGLMGGFGVAAAEAGAFAVLARLVDLVFALVGGIIFLVRGGRRHESSSPAGEGSAPSSLEDRAIL